MAGTITNKETVTTICHESAHLRVQAITPHVSEPPIEEVIERIINLNSGLRDFWGSAHGWAPIEAAQLLSKSRLDWQVSLSECLRIWIQESPGQDSQGRLILAWTNLGSLVEGSMRLFLSVWYQDYERDRNHREIRQHNGTLKSPDKIYLKDMRSYFKKCIWGDTWDNWIEVIQTRRNAIHAYKDRNIGAHPDLLQAIRQYLAFLRYVNARLLYPDEEYVPLETK